MGDNPDLGGLGHVGGVGGVPESGDIWVQRLLDALVYVGRFVEL